jgi:hypothetical protein
LRLPWFAWKLHRQKRHYAGYLGAYRVVRRHCRRLRGLGCLGFTPNNFHAAITRELVMLCSTDPSLPDYPMAISFFDGFAVGAYQYHSHVTSASRGAHFACLPHPPPPRSEAIAKFVAWARAHPETMYALPVDSMFRYLGEQYSCRS